MSELSPELKTLVRCARLAPSLSEPSPPLGFAHGIVRAWLNAPQRSPAAVWPSVLSKSAWAAAAVVLLGLAFLGAQWLRPHPAYDVSTAYQLVAVNVVP